jgi:peptidoglycan/xylan/chitin deacetylase (PgdA/CDA1 family)
MRRLRRPALVLLALLALFVLGWKMSGSTFVQLVGEWHRRVPVDEQLLVLSFDDGPHPIYTPQILDLLAEHDAKASFFVVGARAQEHPELVQRILAEGHEVGNHSWSHRRMVLKSPGWVRHEVERTDALLTALGAPEPIHFRAPFGKKLLVLPWVLSRMGRVNILFDVVPSPPDYLHGHPALIAADIQRKAQPGSIVVLHDGGGERPETVEATRIVLETMGAEGWRFVTARELLERARAEPAA